MRLVGWWGKGQATMPCGVVGQGPPYDESGEWWAKVRRTIIGGSKATPPGRSEGCCGRANGQGHPHRLSGAVGRERLEEDRVFHAAHMAVDLPAGGGAARCTPPATPTA